MKNLFFTAVAFFLFNLSDLQVKAQSRAECISSNGYRVLVGNKNVKKVTTVQFYSIENQLIYQEEVRNQKININRLKTLRCLKKGLDSALIALNLEKQAIHNKNWMAVNLKQ
ncbi:hypothetical protein ABDD95_11225 [Mucilaginibacter sp. PAMB04274]|uniref:hypothetical protein n=1 Tax=Mucilaginibacter sp. PAMB04274 TaxID=3138568 RepID=UPI0031F7054F